jgi:large subunit ribosomal protein L30
MTKAKAKSANKLCVRQVGSAIGCTESQLSCLRGLGLGRIGKKVLVEDNNCIRGLIRKVLHLVKVEDSNE